MDHEFITQKMEEIFSKDKHSERRQLTINIPVELVERLDNILQIRSEIKGSPVTRNTALQEAIEIYLESAESYLSQQEVQRNTVNIVNTVREVKTSNEFDTVIFPSDVIGFENVFMGQKKWYYARIGKDKLPFIKNVALYVTKPVCQISHVAEVKEIKPSKQVPGKYIIFLKETPKLLPHPVALGDVNPAATRSPKYTTLEKLKRVKYYGEL
ncbi:MAG: hypothetical protein HFH47_03005 [Bacilli bacterium]|nr:hypothetical protein [Bacilli bacterium]